MRKYDEAVREAYLAKVAENVHERKLYAAGHVETVLPGPLEEPLPKTMIFEMATDEAVKNGLSEHSFFRGNGGRFHTYVKCNWGSIRRVLRDELGIHVEYGHGLRGIRRAGKRGLEKTMEWERNVIERAAESYNESVDAAKNYVAVPAIQLKLLLP